MLELTNVVIIRKMFDQSLDVAANGVRVGVLGAYDAAVLPVGSVAMALDDEAVLHLEGSFGVVGPFGDFPGFSW
jgi:hypothetical protein